MISCSQQSRSRFLCSSLVFLLIFILSGCSKDNGTASTPSPDQQTQDGTGDQQIQDASDSDTDADTDTNAATDLNTDTDADTNAGTDVNTDTDTDTNEGTDVNTDTDTNTEAASNCNMSELVAFPCAEGYGKAATGGRGGDVYEVTTLDASGPGSLGEAISASGPRTVVFKVAGNIKGTFNITNDDITIAGQTAPGDGVCINGHLNFKANNSIVRYIRVRANADGDAISAGKGKSRIILDHVSTSWSSDEVLSIYQNEQVTIQYCMITEAGSGSHRFGGIWGNKNSTYHHNLIAHNESRNPRWATKGGAGDNDYRNNVIYNWGYMSCYGGAGSEPVNMVANYYKPGPGTESNVRELIASPDGGKWYVADNVMEGSPAVTNDNWLGMDGGDRVDEPWPAMPIHTEETAEEAYKTVLEHAGCALPNRDSVDARIIEEVRTGTAAYGFISNPNDVGGHPILASGPAYPDADHDGMDDTWESANGLDPNDPEDRNITDSVGYTMLEIFLNSLDNF